MLSARECAPAARLTRRSWLAIGLVACLSGSGCARMQSSRRVSAEPPLLGVEAQAGGYPTGELLADSGRKLSPRERREAGATTRTSSPRHEGPVGVALLPPEEAPDWKPARVPEDAPEQPATEDAVTRTKLEPAAQKSPATPSVESLLAEARARLATMTTYRVRLTRQERVGETLHPSEDVILSIRRDPRAVRLEWPEGPHQGREVLYTAGGPMHVKDPRNKILPRSQFAPDSPLVMSQSRHPIGEAGFDSILDRLEADLRASGPERPVYQGLETPEGLDRPCHRVVQRRPGGESSLLHFDAETHLPASFVLRAADGSILESYRFRDARPNPKELADASAFDPEARWGPAQGLLSRLTGHNPESGPVQR